MNGLAVISLFLIRRRNGPYGFSELRVRMSPPCGVADGPPEPTLADWDSLNIWADGRLPCSTGAGPGFATLLEASVAGVVWGTRLAVLRSPCASAELELQTTPNSAAAKIVGLIRKLLRAWAARLPALLDCKHRRRPMIAQMAGCNHQPCSQP
jgi:hypothetical protein